MSQLVGAGVGSLPALIVLNNPSIAYDLWVLWVATDRRFLPSQLLEEPAGLLDDMLTLDGVYNTMQELRKDT